MTVLTLEQFEQLIKTNVLTDPPMWVRNASFPRGQVSFNVLGSDFRMRDVIVPVSGKAIDLTLFAPIQNLLASAELRAVFASGNLKLINPDDMPEPNNQNFPAYTTVTTPVVAGDENVLGLAPAGTQVQIVQDGKINAVFAGTDNTFQLPVTGLVSGEVLEVTFIKEKFETKTISITVSEKPAQPFPQPTVNEYTNFDSEISGTTVAGATVVLKNDGVIVDSVVAGTDGTFALTVPNTYGTLEILFSAEGYTDTSVTVTPVSREVRVTLDTPAYLDSEINLHINPAQPFEFGVEVEVDGQSLINATVPAVMETFRIETAAIKGDVKVTVKSTGYKETDYSRAPNKNTFGDVVIGEVHAEATIVSGSVADLRGADDGKVELVTSDQTKTVNVESDGTFSIDVPPLNAGDASLTFTSAFFDSKTQDFEILEKEIPAPTVNEVYAGDTVISGTTIEGVKVTYGSHEVVAPAGGAFSLTVDPLTAGNIDLVFSKINYSNKTVAVTVKPLTVQAEPTASTVFVGETEINGTAEPSSEIYIDGNKISDVEEDGSFSISGPSMNSPVTLTFKKEHYADKTLVVTPQQLSTFVQPTVEVKEGDTQISGTTEPNTLVTSADASDSVTSDGSGAFTLALKSAAVAEAKIEIGFSKRGYANASFEYTVAANSQPDPTE